MWPAMFGSEWIWGVLVAAALACFTVGVLGFLFLIIVKPPPLRHDEFGETRHRYEEGDLTGPGWERKIRGPASPGKPTNHRVS